MNLVWSFRRLQAMSVREIVFRMGRAVSARLQAVVARRAPTARQPEKKFGHAWTTFSVVAAQDDPMLYEAAHRVLRGEFDVFELHALSLGFPPGWRTDPSTGRTLPLVFGKCLDYRDVRKHGDIRYVWELNRHLELVTLAQAWQVTRKAIFANACVTLLTSWWDANPRGFGPNWVSSLEAAIRLVNWSFAWHLLQDAPAFDGELGARFQSRWLGSVFEHIQFVHGYRSLHSSANNHLFGELAGLFVAALTWPCWPESQRWRDDALVELVREAELQITRDGVNREQAIGYQREVAEFMVVCSLIGRGNGMQFPELWWQRLGSCVEFLDAITNVCGRRPMFGDSDDSCVYRLDPEPGADLYRSLSIVGRALVTGEEPSIPASDRQARWLLGVVPSAMGATPAGRLLQGASSMPRCWQDGGYAVMGRHFGQADEVKLIADAGPLGYLGIAAHGHADALSFTLSVRGRQILIDSGTFVYGSDMAWRRWFCGTRAHNTLCIDGKNQADHAGAFLWLHHYRAQCVEWRVDDSGQRWAGTHDGYRRLRRPATHRREIAFDAARARFTVVDSVESHDLHEIELNWHFHPDCRLWMEGRSCLVASGDARVRVTLPEGIVRFISGEGAASSPMDTPGPGWFSPSFGVRIRAPSIRVTLPPALAGRWSTLLDVCT